MPEGDPPFVEDPGVVELSAPRAQTDSAMVAMAVAVVVFMLGERKHFGFGESAPLAGPLSEAGVEAVRRHGHDPFAPVVVVGVDALVHYLLMAAGGAGVLDEPFLDAGCDLYHFAFAVYMLGPCVDRQVIAFAGNDRG